MTHGRRYEVEWQTADGLLRAFEPTAREVEAVAEQLAAHYNEPHNSAMMAHSGPLSPADVAEHFAKLRAGGDRGFLLEHDGELMGDADLRHIAHRRAEFAIMIGHRTRQGKGLGTRFAQMLHVLAFDALGLERVYVAIIPPNQASQALFRKIGHELDSTPEARSYIDQEDDVTMSMAADSFRRVHAAACAEIRARARSA